jgi:hypothetical protein
MYDDTVVEQYTWIHNHDGIRVRQVHHDLERGRRTEELYTHDERGNLTTIVSTGAVTETRHQTFDDRGRMLRLAQDFANDGSLDRVYQYTYDEEGRALTKASDNDGDGNFDQRCTYNPPCRGRPPFRCSMRCD